MIARVPEQLFEARLDHYRSRVDSKLDEILSASGGAAPRLTAAMAYSVLGGGKRIRPLLAYASAEVFEVDERLVDPIAAAVELVHAYSLVHDDLPSMDNDDLRRGRATTHRKFDEATAILAGDALQALAFEVLTMDAGLSSDPKSQILVVAQLATSIGPSGMAGGQALDIAAEGTQIDEQALENIHRRKTGELIRSSILMPSLLATTSEEARHELDEYGANIGLAFQIRDDLLEIEQDTETLGKSAASDAANAKATYPAVLGVAEAEARADELYARAMRNLDNLGPRSDGLRWLSDYIIRRSN
ncbi:MAG TPA: farnesyl diphosphate synthase [Gammaproteobacteria bacterium]